MNPTRIVGGRFLTVLAYFAVVGFFATAIIWVTPRSIFEPWPFAAEWWDTTVYLAAFYLAARWAGLMGVPQK